MRRSWKVRATAPVAAMAVALMTLAGAGAPAVGAIAQPAPGHTALVPTTPRIDTPLISDGEVVDIDVVGNRVYLAGTFTSIRDVGGAAVAQKYLAAYDIDTGKLDMGFRPTFDKAVDAVEASPDGSGLFVAGQFNTVNGTTRRKIVKLNPTNGSVVTAFTANASARGSALVVSPTAVYVGGFFSTVNGRAAGRLAALNPTTGAVDTSFNLPVTEGIGSGGVLKVQQLRLNADSSRLLVVHTGRKVAGQARTGVAIIDTATKSLTPWSTTLFDDNLARVGGVLRLTNGDIAPDGSWFALTSGSGGDRPPINDTVMAFPLNSGANTQPLWISRHFDSLYAIAITERTVYVGGHFRWEEAPGSTQPWPGDSDLNYGWGTGLGAAVLGDEVVRRDMLGALDPLTGTAVDWNPGATGLEGVKALEAIPRGLLVGHDGSSIGQRNVGRHGFFDFTRVPAPGPAETWMDDPFSGGMYAADSPLVVDGRATATSGVSRVQLEVQNANSGQYLQDNLTTWGGWNAIDATLANPDATSTTWSQAIQLPMGQFRIYARTFARDGSRDSTKANALFETVLVDDLPPSSTITSPPSGLLTTTTFTVSGSALDDKGIDRMSYTFRNTATGAYLQDDGTVGGGYNAISDLPDNPGAQAVTWSYEVTLPEGEWIFMATSVDSAGQADPRGPTRTWQISSTNTAPAVTIASPTTGTVFAPGGKLTITGTATDNVAVRRVQLSVRNLQTREGVTIDGVNYGVQGWFTVTPVNTNAPSVPFSYTTPALPAGAYEISARADDNLEVRTPSAAQPKVLAYATVPGQTLPNTALDFAATNQDYDLLTLPIAGTATSPLGVKAVKLVVLDNTTRRYLTSAAGTTSTAFTMIDANLGTPNGTSTTFNLNLTLPQGGDYAVTAIAQDSLNQWDQDQSGATARYLIFPGDLDPTLVLNSPVPNSTVTNFITIGGRATDDVGIRAVSIQVVNNATGKGLRADGTFGAPAWINTFLTNPGGAGSNFNYVTPRLPAGTYTVYARATDSVGQQMLVPVSSVVTVVAG